MIHAVRARLDELDVHDVMVHGVRGSHIVLNDKGDHWVPKAGVDEKTFEDTFLKLRMYYL